MAIVAADFVSSWVKCTFIALELGAGQSIRGNSMVERFYGEAIGCLVSTYRVVRLYTTILRVCQHSETANLIPSYRHGISYQAKHCSLGPTGESVRSQYSTET